MKLGMISLSKAQNDSQFYLSHCCNPGNEYMKWHQCGEARLQELISQRWPHLMSNLRIHLLDIKTVFNQVQSIPDTCNPITSPVKDLINRKSVVRNVSMNCDNDSQAVPFNNLIIPTS